MGAGNRFDAALKCLLRWAKRRWGLDKELVLSLMKGRETDILEQFGQDQVTWPVFEFYYELMQAGTSGCRDQIATQQEGEKR
jgi:hypothetical protein